MQVFPTVLAAFQPRFPIARVRKYHRMRHKEAALCEVSPLSRFLKRFHQAVNFSWREFLVLSPKEDGVIVGEFRHELDWAQGRPLSMIHCLRKDMDDGSDSEVTKKVNNIISNYGVDRVSDAKAGYFFIFSPNAGNKLST